MLNFSGFKTKEIKGINKTGRETTKYLSYKFQLINRAKFIVSLLLKIKCKHAKEKKKLNGHDNEKLNVINGRKRY